MIHVRDAEKEDLSAVLAIYNDVIRTSTAVYTEVESTLNERQLWLAERQAAGYPVLVAERTKGDVLGYASFSDFRSWPGYRHTVEHSVYVHPAARGCGVGRTLMKVLLERARCLDKHVMIAGIDAANHASVRLHEALGFECKGTLNEVGTKFGRWLDLLWMQRFL